MHDSEYDIQIWWTRGWKCRTSAQPKCDIFNRGLSYLNVARTIVTRSSFDNDERHVTAFWPINEAVHSWPYDKMAYRLALLHDVE